MYRLLIAEEEPASLDALANSIYWEELSITSTNQTTDGLLALEMIKQVAPDILLTTIQLQNMSGLQLLQWVSDHQLPTVVLLIAETSDLDHAQQALRQGAYDVILKPCKPDEIYEVMKSVIQHLDQKRYSLQEMSKMQETLAIPSSVEREQTLWKWLQPSNDKEYPYSEQISRLSLHLQPDKVEVGLMRFVIETMATKRYEDSDMNLIRFAASNILQETLQPYYLGKLEVMTSQSDMVWIANSRKHQDAELIIQLRLVAHHVERYLGLATIFVSGPPVANFSDLPNSYERALRRMESLHFKGLSGCFLERGELPNLETYIGEQNKHDELNPIEATILQELEAHSFSTAIDRLEQWFDKLKSNKHLGKTEIHQRVSAFVLKLPRLVQGKIKLSIEWQAVTLANIEQLPVFDSFEEMTALIRKMIQNWVEQHAPDHSIHRNVKAAIAMIHERYFANLTLESISQEVFVSSAYLSSLFKQEIGMNFTDYLHNYRIEQAKSLLLESNANLYAIAKQVGYKDIRNFNHTFKKWTGLTPSQFQNIKKS